MPVSAGGGGADSHRWGCPQSRWTRQSPAECPPPGLNWVKMAAAGSGQSKRTKEEGSGVSLKQRSEVGRSSGAVGVGQVPAVPPCTPSAVWEEHEDPGCFGALRSLIYLCSTGTAGTQHVVGKVRANVKTSPLIFAINKINNSRVSLSYYLITANSQSKSSNCYTATKNKDKTAILHFFPTAPEGELA